MAPTSIERIITLAASIITLWSVWSAAPIGDSGSILIFDGVSFGPRLVAVFVIDAFVIWILSRLAFFCLQIKQPHVAFVMSVAIFAINSWQSVYLFHAVLFQNFNLSGLEVSVFIVLEICSATMFALLLHSHYQAYSNRFPSPFHIPGSQARRFDIFVMGKQGVIAVSVISYLPFALWVLVDPSTFYR